MIAQYELIKQKGEIMFTLPEFQQFKHIFRKIDPRFVNNLCEENIEKCAAYLLRAYSQCLRRLENVEKGGQINDYNLVLTKNWMMMVLRKQPHLNDIHCNSLGYLGLLFVKDQQKKIEL